MKKSALFVWLIVISMSLYAANERNETVADINLTASYPIYISDDYDSHVPIKVAPGKVDLIDQLTSTANYNTDKYIKTKISGYPSTPKISTKGYQIDAIWLGHIGSGKPEPYAAANSSVPLTVLYYLAENNCSFGPQLFTGLLDGSGKEIPVSAQIFPGDDHATSTRFLMPAIAAKAKRLIGLYIDFYRLFLEHGDLCLLQLSSGANSVPGMPSCVANETQYTSIFGPLTTAKCKHFNGNPCDPTNHGYGDSPYDNMYGCYQCTLRADAEYTCSRDNFAIRPNQFDINSTDPDFPNLLRSGKDYNMTIYAYDYGITSGTVGTDDYNQTKANMDVNESIILANDGSATVLDGHTDWSNDDFNMTNGVSGNGSGSFEVAGLAFDNVGIVTITIQDKNWAAVDINNVNDPTDRNCTADSAYICGDINVTFIPHHFNVENIHLRNHNDSNFTYLSNDLNMSAHLDVNISARNANDGITTNFRQGSPYYENPVSIDMNVTKWLGVASRHPKGNSTHKHDIPTEILLGFGGSDDNGTLIIPWNESNTTQQIMFNYARQNNQTVNPFDINGTDLNITVQSTYTDTISTISPIPTATIAGTGIGDRNATFVFARSRSSRFFYDDVSEDNISTPIFIDVYCDLWPDSKCNELNIDTINGKTNDNYWWLSWNHNENNGDGNITLKVGSIAPTSGTGSAIVDTNVTVIAEGKDPSINVTYQSGRKPMLVEIDLDNTYPEDTNSWLICNPYADSVPIPFYKVRFIGVSEWAGYGDTGKVVESNASIKKNRRLGW